MKNADLPANPTNAIDTAISHDELTGGGRYLSSNGLTKREVFAMHAPDRPAWYKSDFESRNLGKAGIFVRWQGLSMQGNMKLMKEWRYAYADLMLGEDE